MSQYEWDVPNHPVTFVVDRLRREHHELFGELTVRCNIPGARAVNGTLNIGDFNLSSVAARQTRAKLLAQRANTNGKIDWFGLLEEFCQQVFQSERDGDPSVNIWDIEEPEQDEDFAIDGLAFPKHLPSILFGDGGSCKSYLAIFLAGKLAMQGVRVCLFDWELDGGSHKKRFRNLFGSASPRPDLEYCRCEMPMTTEIDRICRIIHDKKIQYGVFDSISFAVDGRAEDHETVLRYFRCVRRTGIGGTHIAHTNRSEESDKKPFGSAFWHNAARATWFAKAEQSGPGVLELGVHHRKANLGPLRPSVAFKVFFDNDSTTFRRVSIIETPGIAEDMKVWQRMEALLTKKGCPMTYIEMSKELGVKEDSIRKTVIRKSNIFHVVNGGNGEQDRVRLVIGQK